jgi:hypothetical protein
MKQNIAPASPAASSRGRTVALYALMFGAGVAFMLVFAPAARADAGFPELTDWATKAVEFLKKLWFFVIMAEVVAALTYAAAFFSQAWFPSFFQAFQGEWIKKAVIMGFAAHPIMGILYAAAAEAAKNGFQGS